MKMLTNDKPKNADHTWSNRLFTQRLITVFFMVSVAFFVGGAVSHYAWDLIFGRMFPDNPSASDLAWQSWADVVAIKPLLNIVMYAVPWGFYAAGCGAFVASALITIVDAADRLLRMACDARRAHADK